MMKLKPCPCGQIPKVLDTMDTGEGGKWAIASGDCCGEWHIYFRTNYEKEGSQKYMELAISEWNDAPRGHQQGERSDGKGD